MRVSSPRRRASMHDGLTVNVSQWPPDLGRLWRETLRPHGLIVEPTADWNPAAYSADV